MNKKILYFTKGPSPTEAELQEAKKLGALFRNGAAVNDSDYTERCDAVAGTVPFLYKDKPRADSVTANAEGAYVPSEVDASGGAGPEPPLEAHTAAKRGRPRTGESEA